MDVRSIFTKASRTGPQLDLDLSAGHPGPGLCAMATGIGASMGAVAIGSVGGSFFGPVGTVCGVAAGAVVGAFAGRTAARRMERAREDAYWKERPYVDTAFGFHDRELSSGDGLDPVSSRPAPLTLADIAAHPAPTRSRKFEGTLPGLRARPQQRAYVRPA